MDDEEIDRIINSNYIPKQSSITPILDGYREQYRIIYMEFLSSTRADRHEIANFKLSQVLFEMNLSILIMLQSTNPESKLDV